MHRFIIYFLITVSLPAFAVQELAFKEATGFGAFSKGGKGEKSATAAVNQPHSTTSSRRRAAQRA